MKKNNIPYIKNDDLIILYDGVCKLCTRWVRVIIQYDDKVVIKFVPMQSEKGQAILQYLKRPLKDYETILFIEKNKTYENSTAFFKIILHLAFPIKILIIFQYLPRSITDYVYKKIAKNRYKIFGKYSQCTLPNHKKKNRYL